jgi:non-specific serine/threonine protein kinase
MDWSHDLLSEEERVLFRRLSVFAGGFALEAAEAVCAGEGIEREEVLDLLASLAEKSLVTVEEREGEARYRLLETVRQFGLERLLDGGEAEETRRRHAAFFLVLAEEARPKLRAEAQVEWLRRLEQENGNLRGALSWALSADDIVMAAWLGWALYWYWHMRNHHPEGRGWMEPVIQRRNELPPWLRIRAIIVFGAMAYNQDGIEVLDRFAGELLEISREAGGDALAEGYTLICLGLLATHRGDFESARKHLEEALPPLHEADEDGVAAQTLTFLGTALLLAGDHEGARRRFEEALALGRSMGDRLSICNALFNLAQLALARGDHDAAFRWFAEGIIPSEELGDRSNVAYILGGLGIVAGARGETERAARLIGASEALVSAIGLRGHAYYQTDGALYDRVEAEAKASLGEAAFETALDEGRAMPHERAIEYALGSGEPAARLSGGATAAAPSPLSERETEVLRLAAEGLTDAQAAQRLYLSPRTVGRHLHSTYRKLGVASRAAATREAVERGLI